MSSVFDPNPSLRWLFCMTHPDDEISICAWIKRLTSQGNEVFISWTHSTPVREAEARRTAEILGVPQSNLFFHGATDGEVAFQIPDLLPKFERMMEQVRPDRVACGAFEQGHIDHDATHYLVSHTFQQKSGMLEIPFYHTYAVRIQQLNRFADPIGESVLQLTPEERRLKVRIAKQYPSQNIFSILRWYEICHRMLARPSRLTHTERMRLATYFDYLTPNLPSRKKEVVVKTEQWQKWTQAMSKLK